MEDNRKITNVIIIGAGKCGTSSLYDYLIDHPEICPCIVKEPEYFSMRFGIEKYNKGEYLDLFNINPDTHRYTLDASTGYTKYPLEKGVPRRIIEYGLNPKFIYMVRNPFERIRSHYNSLQKDLKWKEKIDSPHLINMSKYFMQLEEYKKYFPSENFLVIEFEDLISVPKEICQKVFKFIGASEFNLKTIYKVHNQTIAFNRRKHKLIKFLSPIIKLTPSLLNKGLKILVELILPTKQKQLTKKQKKKLYELIKTDMIRFSNAYKIDVSRWGF